MEISFLDLDLFIRSCEIACFRRSQFLPNFSFHKLFGLKSQLPILMTKIFLFWGIEIEELCKHSLKGRILLTFWFICRFFILIIVRHSRFSFQRDIIHFKISFTHEVIEVRKMDAESRRSDRSVWRRFRRRTRKAFFQFLVRLMKEALDEAAFVSKGKTFFETEKSTQVSPLVESILSSMSIVWVFIFEYTTFDFKKVFQTRGSYFLNKFSLQLRSLTFKQFPLKIRIPNFLKIFSKIRSLSLIRLEPRFWAKVLFKIQTLFPIYFRVHSLPFKLYNPVVF